MAGGQRENQSWAESQRHAAGRASGRARVNQLGRALARVEIRRAQTEQSKAKRAAQGQGEYDQQVQFPFHGNATADWSFVDKQVKLRMPFISAKQQRPVPFETPHFTYGVVLDNPPKDMLIVVVTVVQWTVNRRGWTTGATVRVAAQAPNAGKLAFSGTVHLTFSGYSAYAENQNTQPQGSL
jgi:hypothetical protein